MKDDENKQMSKGNLVNGLMRSYNIKIPGMSKMNNEAGYVAFGKKTRVWSGGKSVQNTDRKLFGYIDS